MLDRNLVYGMNRDLERLSKLNEQLSTGQRINTFSDDVPGADAVLRLQRANGRIGTYLENIDSAGSMLSSATSTLQSVSEVMTQIRQLAVQAATETYSDTDRQIMAQGVDNMLNTLVSLANVDLKGNYVFAGEATHTSPYAVTKDAAGQVQSVTYQGEMVSTEAGVGPRSTTEMNLVGEGIFRRTGDIFRSVMQLRDAMKAGDTQAINQLLGALDTSHTDITVSLGRLGERQNQLQVMKASLQTLKGLNDQGIADKQGADMAQVTVEYNSMQALLQMVMKIAAQGAMPSIMDYM
jgi:flagellar hook-associated protein 3 FlgL